MPAPRRSLLSLLLLLLMLHEPAAAQIPPLAPPPTDIVQTFCIDCHGGDKTKGKLDLTVTPPGAVEALWRASRVRERVLAGEMPPADADAAPPAAQRALVQWADGVLRAGVPDLPSDPGRVTVRRLSRTQWENTVRDLFGVAVSTADFPADDLGYGFDTIGDALTFSTLHLEQYVAAAGAVAAQVFDGEDPLHPASRHFEGEAMRVVDGPATDQSGEVAYMITRATVEQSLRLPRDGNYRVSLFAGADQAGDEPAKMQVLLDGHELATYDVPNRDLERFGLTTPLPGGEHRLGISFVNDFYDPKNPDPQRRDRNLRLDWCEVTGPLDARQVPPAQAWLHAAMAAGDDDAARLHTVVAALLPRVWRRPATDDETERLIALGTAALRDGALDGALRLVLQAALASPHFLFRIEDEAVGGAPGEIEPVVDAALATRLSYFLWSSAPDTTLRELADANRLHEPAVLDNEVRRLLADARADALATDFAAQWLELRNLQDRTPDPARFPGFDDELRSSLGRETELLFVTVLREQRDVRDLLDCDFTFVDARLAAFYGLPVPSGDAAGGPSGDGFVRVSLPPALRERGGLLGHGSMLAVTSNPTRTSPVKRGKWILDNLLGQPPPPPPNAGNDALLPANVVDSTASLREQMALHRAQPKCAACHVRMDQLGFALERYDAIGRYRARDAGGDIDCRGELPGGKQLDGLAGLKAALRDDPAFVRTVAQKLFVYAVGRNLRPVDRLRLDFAVDELRQQPKVTLADLVLTVVHSDAFRLRVVAAH